MTRPASIPGVVFRIDAATLRALGPLDAGRCLAHWDAVAKALARRIGGMRREGPEFNAHDCVDSALADRLRTAGFDAAATQHLLQALELHAMRSAMPFAMACTIEVLPGGMTRDVPLRHGYALAFGMALPRLGAALAGNIPITGSPAGTSQRSSTWPRPGATRRSLAPGRYPGTQSSMRW